MSFSDDLKASLAAYILHKENESDSLRDQLIQLEAAQAKLNSDLANLEFHVETFKDTTANLLGRVAVLEGSSAALESRVQQSRLAEAALSTRVGALESRVDVLDDPFKPKEPTEPTEPAEPDPVPDPVKPPPTIPADATIVPLYVRESASVSRSRAFVSTGVPIAESLNVTDLSRLALLDSQGFPVQADFRPTSYWRTSKSPKGMHWVQVSFFDKFGAGQEKQYKLVITKQPMNLEFDLSPLNLINLISPKEIMVHTGAMKCIVNERGINRLGKDGSSTYFIDNSIQRVKFDGVEDSLFNKLRRLEVEYAGPLVAYIYVETETNLKFGDQLTTRPSKGKDAAGKPIYPQGSIVVSRRYEFRAGSGTVMCQQTIKWEGTKNGTSWTERDGVKVNGVLGELWQDTFTLSSKPSTSEIIVSEGVSYIDGDASKVSFISQNLRPNRLAKRSLTIDKITREGTVEGLLSLLYGENCLCFGLYHMDKYEPQSLVFDPATSSICVSYASDKFWLAHHQGVSVRSGIALEDESKLDEVWAELNHPLRIFAQDSAYYSVAGLGAVPSTQEHDPSQLALSLIYQKAIKSICDSTLMNIDRFGLYGLQTYAGLPRYWGTNDGGDEVGQVRSNQANDWDHAYKYGAFTDYYSSSRTAATLALLSGDSKYLDLLSIPSADRMLHTQIWCGSPDDRLHLIGWSPTGYNAYRADMNSSHSYYENLYWYYFLSGDRQVIDIISRGENHFVNALKSSPLGGRHPHQHIEAMRFLKHSHYDYTQASKYSAAYESIMLRAIDECYVEGTYNGEVVGLWVDGKKKPNAVNYTTNHYAGAIWDMESLYLFSLERPDLTEKINNILVKTALTLIKYGPKLVGGDGTIAGKWSRTFKFVWNGLDGSQSTITDLSNKNESGETVSLLYDMDKPGMCAHWVRAAKLSGDPDITKKSEELLNHAIDRIIKSKLPMGKLMGLCECRLMVAVGTMQGDVAK